MGLSNLPTLTKGSTYRVTAHTGDSPYGVGFTFVATGAEQARHPDVAGEGWWDIGGAGWVRVVIAQSEERKLDDLPWRVGRHVGRNIYDGHGNDIGRMDTAELAARVVAAVNGERK